MSVAVGDAVELTITEVAGYACWGVVGAQTGFVHCVEWSGDRPIPDSHVPKIGDVLRVEVFRLVEQPQSELPADVTFDGKIHVDFAGSARLLQRPRPEGHPIHWHKAVQSSDATRWIVLASISALLGLIVWWIWPRGPDLRTYAAAVEVIRSAPGRRLEFERKYQCHIEPGPPFRVAFVQPGSLLDNWVGVVYDPTGEVLKANQFRPDWSNWGDPALMDVKKLFGGDLRAAESLGGPWYLCTFT